MTNNNILYFPYINVPKTDWTIRSILYWDKVGSIIPQSFLHNPSQFNPEMRELMEQELIEVLQPDHYYHDIYKFEAAFLRELTSSPSRIDKYRRKFQAGKVTKIHFDKMIHSLFVSFKELGIGDWENNRDWNWFYLESSVAHLYMTYLATAIGRASKYTPATDKKNNIINSYFLKEEQRQTLRQQILENVIPTPIDIDLYKIRQFKDKYHEDLIRFRRTIEQTILNISNLPPEDYSEALALKIEEINDKKNQISSNLNQAGFKRIGIGDYLLIASSAVLFLGDTGLLSGGTFFGSVFTALKKIKNKSTDNEFAYIAHYENKLGKRK